MALDLGAMRRHWKLLLAIAVAIVLALGAVGYLWLTVLVDPMPETDAALVSDGSVTVETDPWLTFTPTEPADTGFIFYPGGRVPAEAYALAARAIAEAGYLTVVPSMPFGLAVLAPDTADGDHRGPPGDRALGHRWPLARRRHGRRLRRRTRGRSRGSCCGRRTRPVAPTSRAASLAVTSVFATEDGLATVDEIEASRSQLPPDTEFVEIAGGNHAGFGWYGEQDGDGEATISREEQQAAVVEATLDLLEVVEEP